MDHDRFGSPWGLPFFCFCEIFRGSLGSHRRLAAFLFGELSGVLLIGGGILILGGVLCYTYLEAAK